MISADLGAASRWTGIKAPVPSGLSIEDGCGSTTDEIFALFRASGYLQAAREASLAAVIADVRRTFAAAYDRPSEVFESTVARQGRALIGHVSSVRAYDRTWVAQHLVAAPSKHVAHLLALGVGERLLADPRRAFCKFWYLEHKSWPRRVFGGFARTVADARCSDLRGFRRVTMDLDGDGPGCSGECEVADANEVERRLVAGYFAAREPELLVRADDLDAEGLSLANLDESFATTGLVRRRGVLMARHEGACVGVALAELASPGLNLSEILSSFRIFVLPEGESRAWQVRRALLGAVARFYRAVGRRQAHGLISGDEVPLYEALGLIVDEETWNCSTLERRMTDQFCVYLDRLFACLRRPRGGDRP
jgi:hypothetical protein